MAWYVCDGGAHAAPVLVQNPLAAPPCTTCGGATTLAHDRVRVTHNFPALGGGGLDYELRWDVNGDDVALKLRLSSGRTLMLPNDAVPYDATLNSLTSASALAAPGGGSWTNDVGNH